MRIQKVKLYNQVHTPLGEIITYQVTLSVVQLQYSSFQRVTSPKFWPKYTAMKKDM